jgi:hypothetical protein
MTPHLTHEQLCDLILAQPPHRLSSDFAALDQHLGSCPLCAEELARLRSSIELFRESSTVWARQQFAEVHARTVSVLPPAHALSRPLVWIAAAAALVLAVIVPMELRQYHAAPPAQVAASQTTRSTESDEALLEEIDQDLSASVPSPMRPLSDPTASMVSAESSSTQTKD